MIRALHLLPLLLLTAACSRSGEKPAATDIPGRSDTVAAPSANRWSVTGEGAGPIRIGMSIAEARVALGGALTLHDSGAPCYHARPADGPGGVSFMVTDGRIARVEVESDAVATEAGARVGDSEERIRSLYGGRVEVTPHKYTGGHYLVVGRESGNSRIVFETDGARVVRYRSGKLPEVEWVEGCS